MMRTAVVVACACAAAGCAPATPTATPPPITWPSPFPSATPLPSATPTPWPTKTAIPTVDPAVPFPVAMTLAQARAEVMSWLDPGHAPRILSADYVPGAAAGFERDYVGAYIVEDFYGGSMEDRRLKRLPTTLVRVIADIKPLVASLPVRMPGFSAPPLGDLRSEHVDERCRLVAWFDALSGARLGVVAIDRPRDGPRGLAPTEPTAAITYAVTAAPLTSTPPPWPAPATTPAPTPIGQPIDADHVPPALRDVLAAYPLLPGSTWTWDSTMWEYDVTWSTWRSTETVTGAWRVDDRRIVVRAVARYTGLIGPRFKTSDAPAEEEVWRTVDANGVVAVDDRPGRDPSQLSPPMRIAADAARFGLPVEALGFAHEGGSIGMGLLESVSKDRISVTTPAGRFEGCGVIEVTTSAGSGSARAICPGVGYVETDTWAFHVAYGWRTVSRLVAYHVVLPR